MKFTKTNKKGSALIMAIAVVTMLAIVGAMFLLMSRIEEGSTSSLEEFKSLDAAVDSVIATVATELKLDTPGVKDANNSYPEYYDYPGNKDKWLANIEPYEYGTNDYRWGQITDLFDDFTYAQQQNITPVTVKENDKIDVDAATGIPNNAGSITADADADGDGVADSKWVRLRNVSSSTGRPIYAAIRVIDNGGMLNVNTGYKFDPNSTERNEIDGTRQTQINLLALDGRDNTHSASVKENRLIGDRTGTEPNDLDSFYYNTVFRYVPQGNYTLYDISDELKLRNRYLINYNEINTRIEKVWTNCFDADPVLPIPTPAYGLPEWLDFTTSRSTDPNDYDYRHIATTYNVDRTIDPKGNKALRVNDTEIDQQYIDPNIQTLYSRIADEFDRRFANSEMTAVDRDDYKKRFAQLLANLKDFDDHDEENSVPAKDAPQVTVLTDEKNDEYYGFERPYVFISELVRAFKWDNDANQNDPNTMHRSYGIEIFKDPRTETFNVTNKNDFRLRIENGNMSDIVIESENFEDRGGRFYVRIFDDKDPNAIQLEDEVAYSDSPWDGATGVDPNAKLSWSPYYKADPNTWQYDFYIGTDPNSVKEANSTVHPGVINYERKPYNNNYYVNPTPFGEGQPYYWRVDDVDGSGKAIKGDVWKFTTWTTEPNNLEAVRDINSLPVFDKSSILILERLIQDKNGSDKWLEVDRVNCDTDVNDIFFANDEGTLSYKRYLSWQKVLKRIWEIQDWHSLGNYSGHFFGDSTDPVPLNGHEGFINIGEVGYVYDVDIYNWDRAKYTKDEDVLVDLTDPNVNLLFNYLTRIYSNDSNEARIKGRININTAPWYVIAQLPWVSKREAGVTLTKPYALAKAIVAYRDKLNLSDEGGSDYFRGVDRNNSDARRQETGLTNKIREELGFSNIGELTTVINSSSKDEYDMRYYILGSSEKGNDQVGYPDLHFDERTGTDGMVDDLEERDLIFARISDLVAVRSDLFTAYILVRLGEDGPQRRVIATLDRSEVTPTDGKVKVVVKYPVPDPR